MLIIDEQGILGNDLSDCESCFLWQYASKGDNEWTTFEYDDSDDISMSMIRSQNVYKSKLVVQSTRRMHSGHCVHDDDASNHPFEEGTDYRLRLKFVSDSEDYYLSEISGESNFSTNTLPNGGECSVQNIDSLAPLETFNLLCDEWENEQNITYNALLQNVMMNTDGFVENASDITGIAPAGNVTITVLVRELNAYNAITCYEIDASFPTISANETDVILNFIDSLIANESFYEKPSYAVSVQTAVEDMFDRGFVNQSVARKIIDNVVGNMLNTSTPTGSDGEAIITELSAFSAVTSNDDIVDWESTTTELVDAYFPDIFHSVDLYIDSANNSSSTEVQDALYTIGEQSQELILNLEATLVDAVNISNATDQKIDSINVLSESLIDHASYAASTALARSEAGESFKYESNSKKVFSSKFDTHSSSSSSLSCGSGTQSLTLPATFTSDNDGTFECVFMSSNSNTFIPFGKRNVNRSSIKEGTVSGSIYSSDLSRRRRLSTEVKYNTTACFPYLITMTAPNSSFHLNMSLDESFDFPSCDFWNTNDSYWDTSGCFIYDIVNDSIICGCTHLTSFSLSASEVLPTTNTLTSLDNLNFDNLIEHPTVWVVVLSLFTIFGVICIINPRASKVNDASILGNDLFILLLSGRFKAKVLFNSATPRNPCESMISAHNPDVQRLQQSSRDKLITFQLVHIWITALTIGLRGNLPMALI